MSRLRYNGLATGSAGSLTALSLGGSLSSGATSVTFSAALTYQNGTAVPTIVAPDYIPLTILDSGGLLSEIVYLTAYTSAGTTGTITRGREGTTGVAHSSGDKVVHGPTVTDVTTLDQFPEKAPASPSAYDDEFDGTSSVTWTNTPYTPNAWDVNTTIPGNGYLFSAGSSAKGKLQAVPGAYPFTITAKMGSSGRLPSSGTTGSNGAGLCLWPASPTTGSAMLWLGQQWSGSTGSFPAIYVYCQRILYSNQDLGFTSASEASGGGMRDWAGPIFTKIKVNSATSVDCYMSRDGKVWYQTDAALNPGFTPGLMGFAASDPNTLGQECWVEWFRVT